VCGGLISTMFMTDLLGVGPRMLVVDVDVRLACFSRLRAAFPRVLIVDAGVLHDHCGR
jgi:hypothetical protein